MVVPKNWLRPDILCASLVINLLGLVMPLVILQAYDRIIPNEALDTLSVLIAVLVVAALIEALLRVVRANALAWFGAQWEHQTHVHFLKRLLHVDTLVYNQHARGYFLSKLSSVDELTRFCSGQSMIMLIDFPFALLFLGLIWLVCGPLVWVPIALLCLYAVVSLWVAKRLGGALKGRHDLEQQRQNFLIESLGFVHTVKAMALESVMMRRYERLQKRSAEGVSQVSFMNNLVQSLGSTVTQLGMVLVVGLGSAEVLSGELSLGALAAATMLTTRAIAPGIKAMSLWTSLQTVKLANANAQALEKVTEPVQTEAAQEVDLNNAVLEAKSMSYQYPGTQAPVFSDVSFQLTVGDSVAVTGATGSGKSTLAMMLAGYLEPTQGELLLADTALAKVPAEQLRDYLCWAPQRGVLYEGTLLENMTLFRTGEAVNQALYLSRVLGLEPLINRLPDGLETRVGGAAIEPVSQAVRQLVTLIRALVGHPQLLVLDDVNAMFDFRLDRHLYHYLRSIQPEKALFIVSNRPSFLRLCKQVYELDQGRFVDLRAQQAKAGEAAND
ncbi:MAG: peptidase domain-containing ABC transporter [Pontibacterium sp.]